jgi:hypothetical protein
MKVPLLRGQHNYFANTLKAFNRLSIDKWLADAGITPSLTIAYPLTDIHSALANGLGFKVNLKCLAATLGDYPMLSGIGVCLRKDTLQPFDCPIETDAECGTDSVAYMPSIQKKSNIEINININT